MGHWQLLVGTVDVSSQEETNEGGDTYYVYGIQLPLFCRLKEVKLLVQDHTANKRDSNSYLGPSGSQFMLGFLHS